MAGVENSKAQVGAVSAEQHLAIAKQGLQTSSRAV